MRTVFVIDADFVSNGPLACAGKVVPLRTHEHGVTVFTRSADDREQDIEDAVERLIYETATKPCRVVRAALTVTRFGSKGPRSRVFDLRNCPAVGSYFGMELTEAQFGIAM